MSKSVNLVKNLLFTTVSTATNVFLFVILILASRILDVTDFGILNFAIAFAAVFEILIDFGLRDISVVHLSREPGLTRKYAGNLLGYQAGLLLVLTAIIGVSIPLFNMGGDAAGVILLLSMAAFFRKIKMTFRLFYQVHDLFHMDTLLVIFERGLLLIVCGVVLFVYKSLLGLAIAFALVRFIDVGLTLALIHFKIEKLQIQFDFSFLKKLQIEAIPRGVHVIVLVILAYTDTLMLKAMTSYQEVALYNAAHKIYEGINLLPMIFYMVLLPKLSWMYKHQRDLYSDLAHMAVKTLFVIGLWIAAIGCFFSESIIRLVFDVAYLPSIPTLQILFLGFIFLYPIWMLHTILISSEKQRVVMVTALFGLVINVLFNYIYIPRFGANGAALVTVVSQAVQTISVAVYLGRSGIGMPFFPVFGKTMISMLIPVGILFWFRDMPEWTIAGIGTIMYVLLLLILKAFGPKEFAAVREQMLGIFKR